MLRAGVRLRPLHRPRLKALPDHSLRNYRFVDKFDIRPRVILLENHGIITLGRSPDAVKAAMFMAEKAAIIFAGAAMLGGPQLLVRRKRKPHRWAARRTLPPKRPQALKREPVFKTVRFKIARNSAANAINRSLAKT